MTVFGILMTIRTHAQLGFIEDNTNLLDWAEQRYLEIWVNNYNNKNNTIAKLSKEPSDETEKISPKTITL